MIAYEMLVQTIADWKAGVRPTAPSLPPIPTGAPEVVEEFDSGIVDMDDGQYGDGEYAVDVETDTESEDGYAVDVEGEHAAQSGGHYAAQSGGHYAAQSGGHYAEQSGGQYAQGDYAQAQPGDSGVESYQDDEEQ